LTQSGQNGLRFQFSPSNINKLQVPYGLQSHLKARPGSAASVAAFRFTSSSQAFDLNKGDCVAVYSNAPFATTP
jgi:hypothetical protein